jgi:RNA polymerase subunit RPABC4/transcription elongation factor Spt4
MEDALKCKKCGCHLEPNFKICPECGQSVQESPLKCKKCGCDLEPNFKICPECGYSLQLIKCKKCGYDLEPDFKVCPECGQPVQPIKCKKCGCDLKPNFKVCPECGRPVQAQVRRCVHCNEKLKAGEEICPACGKHSMEKSAVKKQAEKKTPVKKPAAQPEEISDVKFRNLFDAYHLGKLPFSQGYIVSSFFSETSAYSIYEIVSYAGVKEIFMTETGLQFVTGGKKLYVLVEPDTYQVKFQEPVSRADGERIPKRFNELEIFTAKNQTKIMIAKEPTESYGSFTILKPTGSNFAVVFYKMPDLYKTIAMFFAESLNRQRKVPEYDAKKAALIIADILKKHMSFEVEYK